MMPALSRRRFLAKSAAAAGLVLPAEAQIRSASNSALRTRGMFLHVWDLEDEGVDRVLGWIRDSGLNQLLIASSYHSGWFVHPRKEKRRLYMTQGGVLYFPPDPKIFRATPIKPQVADFARKTNWLRRAGDQVDRYGLRLVSWTIGAHSTLLGQRYPQYTQHTAYGDSLPHALSIGHDAVRAYLKAICRDLATNYPMYGVQLESFGWTGVAHGHHHERDLTGLRPFEQSLLSTCFNPETMKKAEQKGIDAGRARAWGSDLEFCAFVLQGGHCRVPRRGTATVLSGCGDIDATCSENGGCPRSWGAPNSGARTKNGGCPPFQRGARILGGHPEKGDSHRFRRRGTRRPPRSPQAQELTPTGSKR